VGGGEGRKERKKEREKGEIRQDRVSIKAEYEKVHS